MPLISDLVELARCPCGRAKNPEAVTQRANSRNIDRQLRMDQRRMSRQVKLLLLGAGESGKSTFLKQMRIIHGVEWDQNQIDEYRQIIYGNILRGMRVLLDAARKLDIELHNNSNKVFAEQLLNFNKASAVNQSNFYQFGPVLKSLWVDPGVQAAFDRRNEFQLADSVKYFLDEIERIQNQSYAPSQQDILFCRQKTNCIIEFPLVVEDVPFLFVDVGGQRTERRKWLHCFDSVTAILFIASSSEFDQVLAEDRKVNRLLEAVNIFDTIVNNRTFQLVTFILFLNKMDLLQEKVEERRVSISDHFPEEFADRSSVLRSVERFGGDASNLDDVKNFILHLFVSKQKDVSKPLYNHFTTAVDTRNIMYVFNSVKEIILRKNLGALMLQ